MSGFVGSTSCFLNSSMLLHGTLRSSFSNATSLLFLWICKFCSLGQFRISEFLKLGGRERRTFRLCSSFFFFFKHLVRSRCKIIYKILLCSHIPSENWQSRILNVPISRTRKMRLRLWRKGPSWELALCLISLGETKSRETPLLCPVFLRGQKNSTYWPWTLSNVYSGVCSVDTPDRVSMWPGSLFYSSSACPPWVISPNPMVLTITYILMMPTFLSPDWSPPWTLGLCVIAHSTSLHGYWIWRVLHFLP